MKTSNSFRFLLIVALIVAAACAGEPSGPGGSGGKRTVTRLTITPAAETLMRGDVRRVRVDRYWSDGTTDTTGSAGWTFEPAGSLVSAGPGFLQANADTGAVVLKAYDGTSGLTVTTTWRFKTATPTTPIGVRFLKRADTTTVGSYYHLNYTVTLANGSTGSAADITGGAIREDGVNNAVGYFTGTGYTDVYAKAEGAAWVVLALNAFVKDSLHLVVRKP